MHELPVVQALLELTLRHARQAQAQRVLALDLVIGQMSSIVDEAVQFYWDLLSRGTLAEGAVLRFRRVPARFRCTTCGHEYGYDGGHLPCPRCASPRVRLVQGAEFRLEAIEVE